MISILSFINECVIVQITEQIYYYIVLMYTMYHKLRKKKEFQSHRNSFFLLIGFKPVQHSGVSQKRNGTLMNK